MSSGPPPQVAVYRLRAGDRVTNILGTSQAKRTVEGSFIKHWENHSGCKRGVCSALDCNKDATSGGHVKISRNLLTSYFEWNWYVIPCCAEHNKGLSCKNFAVKNVLAVEAPPSLEDRVKSYKFDMKKLVQTAEKKFSSDDKPKPGKKPVKKPGAMQATAPVKARA